MNELGKQNSLKTCSFFLVLNSKGTFIKDVGNKEVGGIADVFYGLSLRFNVNVQLVTFLFVVFAVEHVILKLSQNKLNKSARN